MRYMFDQNILKYFQQFERKAKSWPLNLGGSSYGLGGPPGGFTGYLPQIRVSYDDFEVASSGIPASGISLIDNLNHIRYRLDILEAGGGEGGVSIEEDDILVASGIVFINFEGGVDVVDDGGNQVTVTISGSATDEQVKISSNDTTADYLLNKLTEGTGITITEIDDGGDESIEIASTIVNTDEKVKVSSNDTLAGYLFSKLTPGSGIDITEFNDGGNEQVEITCTSSGGGDTVKISDNDTTSGYLNGKLVSGTGITLTELNDSGDESLRVDCTVTASGITGEVEFRIPIDGFGKGAAKPTETVLADWFGYAFSINDLGYFSFEVPEDWDEVSDIDIALHWYIDEAYATNSGEVRFAAIATVRKEDGTEAVDSGTYTYNGSDMNIPATAKALTEYEIEIPAADIALHDVIGFQIKRIALSGGNNPTAEPVIVGMEAEYVRKLSAIGGSGDELDFIAIQVFC